MSALEAVQTMRRQLHPSPGEELCETQCANRAVTMGLREACRVGVMRRERGATVQRPRSSTASNTYRNPYETPTKRG
jgi:hypothetical protein